MLITGGFAVLEQYGTFYSGAVQMHEVCYAPALGSYVRGCRDSAMYPGLFIRAIVMSFPDNCIKIFCRRVVAVQVGNVVFIAPH